MNKNKEIEIKIQIDEQSLENTKKWLQKTAEKGGSLNQTDYYLNRPDAPFFFVLPDGKKDALDYLRIRVTDNKSYLCFKKVKSREENEFYCDEYEVVISDPQITLELFKTIGYTDITIVNKKREFYLYDIFEIAIDTVKDLGVFVEIEIKKPVKSVEIGHRLIRELLEKIGIKNFERHHQGYVRMLWNQEK